MRINEVAKLTGVSARTLQYYDEIGLLIPEKLNNGYRDYSDENLDKLQKILFYRFLKFKLNDIKELLDGDIDSLKILEQQRELILKEKENFEIILHNIEKTIKTYKGEQKMSIEEKFNGFKKEDLNKYEDQAIEKYGKGTIEESKKRQSGKEDIVAEKFNSIFRSMAEYRKNNINIEEKEVQSKVEELYNYMNKYAFDCSVEVFSYIGKGYSQNPEFKKNIDKFGEGVAEYTSRAIDVYCKSRLNKYEDEAIGKYGKETIEESKKRQSGKEDIIAEKFNSVFRSMAEYRKNNINIEEKEVQSKVEELYNYMNKYAFDCSVEVFSYIGKGYSQNPEFKNNIDKFGEGVAEYTSKAIEVFCNSRLNR